MRRRLAGALLGLVALSGCLDSTPPSARWNLQSIDAVEATLEEATAIFVEASVLYRQNQAGTAFLPVARSVIALGDSIHGLPGRTFAWSLDSARYFADPTRTGAPADGIRFLLYAVTAAADSVARPLVEVGYADVSRVATGTHLRTVIGGVTTFDLAVTHWHADSTFSRTCCLAVLGRFPRRLQATGTARFGAVDIPISITDTVLGSLGSFSGQGSYVGFDRHLRIQVPGRGTVSAAGQTYTSLTFSDADPRLDVSVTFLPHGAPDSLTVTAAYSGIRALHRLDSLSFAGRTDIVSIVDRCNGFPSNCLLFVGTHLDTTKTRAFLSGSITGGTGSVVVAYRGLRSLEAMLSPVLALTPPAP